MVCWWSAMAPPMARTTGSSRTRGGIRGDWTVTACCFVAREAPGSAGSFPRPPTLSCPAPLRQRRGPRRGPRPRLRQRRPRRTTRSRRAAATRWKRRCKAPAASCAPRAATQGRAPRMCPQARVPSRSASSKTLPAARSTARLHACCRAAARQVPRAPVWAASPGCASIPQAAALSLPEASRWCSARRKSPCDRAASPRRRRARGKALRSFERASMSCSEVEQSTQDLDCVPRPA
mmetsp:Transcript_83954/g.271698  ORF Transcript_83954/g.271698 Transcript_83954/m.271698 type:complete len:235 (+) Transcript_83954:898-1602(+)